MREPLPSQYEPETYEKSVYETWLKARAFAASPRHGQRPYVIMMPLPNVTGALHMGHAMDNVMQDLLIRWHRMEGENALWMPGLDHAGIATQAVVEKRLFELEGKTRHDLGRAALVSRIWAWNDQYRERIIEQQQKMGCSCDWDRHRYTMDPVCGRAVRWTFFKLFRDGLIVQGDRMINWDCHLQTAVSDDEIIRETRPGSFWHLKYPFLDPATGEPDHVVVATTRPETMLGDTAVACHPDPEAALQDRLDQLREKRSRAPAREHQALDAEMAAVEARRSTHLPGLLRLVKMARAGRMIRLPLQDRPIPLILDSWARPEMGSGCVKITPAHDPNDHDVWLRHRDEIDLINILNPDGTLNEQAGPYASLPRMKARKRVVQDMEKQGLLERVEERVLELALSDRSKTVIEPYVSRQWFIRMGDLQDGVCCGQGTTHAFKARGLAQAALDAVEKSGALQNTPGIAFHPDDRRYRKAFLTWLAEKRDWCISRQLWWGHRIPVWTAPLGPATSENTAPLLRLLQKNRSRPDLCVQWLAPGKPARLLGPDDDPAELLSAAAEGTRIQLCVRDAEAAPELVREMEAAGLVQDPDVLDTWFSSGLWPHSTLGWPDPETAATRPGQTSLAAAAGEPDCLSFYYPGSCLVTGRDIITLWVVRMVVMGLYNMGQAPFTDVFIHATILDGNGERMSKSKGNGIDPVDIIRRYGTDAMRFVLAEMQTGTQDIRLPVQAVSPFTGDLIDLATARHGQSIFTYICPRSGKEFDVLGSMPDLPAAHLVSDRFDVGRHFCNKLWNAARFALMNLEDTSFTPHAVEDLEAEDRWILSRLSRTTAEITAHLADYNPSAALGAARELFRGDVCDWYLELIKVRLQDEQLAPLARQMLALILDQVLRLLHPFLPFVTETLWERLNSQAPARGLDAPLSVPELLMTAAWPVRCPAWEDAPLEERVSLLRELVRAAREIRSRFNLSPARELAARIKAHGPTAAFLTRTAPLLARMARLAPLSISGDAGPSADAASAVVGETEIYLAGVVDPETERQRLRKRTQTVRKELAAARKKLNNAGFLAKARSEIVEKERRRAADMQQELQSLASSLAALE